MHGMSRIRHSSLNQSCVTVLLFLAAVASCTAGEYTYTYQTITTEMRASANTLIEASKQNSTVRRAVRATPPAGP